MKATLETRAFRKVFPEKVLAEWQARLKKESQNNRKKPGNDAAPKEKPAE